MERQPGTARDRNKFGIDQLKKSLHNQLSTFLLPLTIYALPPLLCPPPPPTCDWWWRSPSSKPCQSLPMEHEKNEKMDKGQGKQNGSDIGATKGKASYCHPQPFISLHLTLQCSPGLPTPSQVLQARVRSATMMPVLMAVGGISDEAGRPLPASFLWLYLPASPTMGISSPHFPATVGVYPRRGSEIHTFPQAHGAARFPPLPPIHSRLHLRDQHTITVRHVPHRLPRSAASLCVIMRASIIRLLPGTFMFGHPLFLFLMKKPFWQMRDCEEEVMDEGAAEVLPPHHHAVPGTTIFATATN